MTITKKSRGESSLEQQDSLTMARQETSPAIFITSHVVLVRLLVALTVMTVFLNLMFLLPLEESSIASNEHAHPLLLNNNNNNNKHPLFQNKKETPLIQNSDSNKQQSRPLEVSFPKLSEEEGRQHILDSFQEAGVELTPEMKYQLPTWSQVQEVVGTRPYLLGLERCEEFRNTVPALERMLGSAGMFNSGTNLVTHLLKQNCEIPERREHYGPSQSKESYGMRWQVPWGKHTPAKFRLEHATKRASEISKDSILPVVTIRNPYTWFQSMCKNAYTAKWEHRKQECPKLQLAPHGDWTNPVSVKFADGREDHHKSLAHLWNDWYSYYIDQSDFPFVVVRMEDLVFYPKETTKAVCECAGGKIRTDQPFQFIVDSAKADSPGHDHSTGIYAAWVKYSKRPLPRHGLFEEDYVAAKQALNQTLMESLGYHHPPVNE